MQAINAWPPLSRDTRAVTSDGQPWARRQQLAEACRRLGVATNEGAYKRLLAWSDEKAVTPKVKKSGSEQGWRYSVEVAIDSPVEYLASSVGATIDDAAAKVIEELEAVQAWEDGKPTNRFNFA